MSPGRQFRDLLLGATDKPLITPSVFNAQSAQIAANTGFETVWIGGSTVTNTLLGMPDAGYLNLSEIEFVVSRTVAVSPVPVLVDIDDSYGPAINTARAVRTMELCGAAGVMIEDQYSPRTPYEGTVAVVPLEEAVGKIKAAVEARRDTDFFIVARTDVGWSEGIEASIERCRAFVDAGADAIFATGDFTVEDMARIGREVKVRHKKWAHPRQGRKASLNEIRELGYDNTGLGGVDLLRAATLAMVRYLEDVHERGIEGEAEQRVQFSGTAVEDWGSFTGFGKIREAERRYLPDSEYRKRYGVGKEAEFNAKSWAAT